jgi:NTE family protein
VADLVPRSAVHAYPTNFAAMTQADLQALALRGEQLTRTLITAYSPDLGW